MNFLMKKLTPLIVKIYNKMAFNYTSFCKSYSLKFTFVVLMLLCSILVLRGQSETPNSNNETITEMISKIKTDIDPSFIYEYEKSKFVPPEGKTLLIMGQTVERIEEYMDHFSDRPIPGGWSAYWGVTESKGIKSTFKNETGSSQNHQMLVKKFPNTVVQSALWMVGKWEIAKRAGNGQYDKVIKKYCKWAKKAKRPIYLRIGYEFDGPHNAFEPKEYVRAYRYIVDLMRREGVENVAFVWHSYASPPYKGYPVADWYPGDDYVDWVGISVFGHSYAGTDFGPDCDNVLEFAKQHKKPVMIAEANPIQGIDKDNTDAWDDWFVNFFSFTYQKNIKAISFINENWPALTIPGISEWKDGRLSNNAKVVEAWFMETGKDRYLKQSADLYGQLGYKKQ